MRRSRALALATAACLLVAATAPKVHADPPFEGTYDLSQWFGSNPSATLWVARNADGSYAVTRQGADGAIAGGTATVSGGWLRVTFYDRVGAADVLDGLGDAQQTQEIGWAIYHISEDSAYGIFTGPDVSGGTIRLYERGDRGPDRPVPGADDETSTGDPDDDTSDDVDSDAPRVVAPANGVFLVGQTVALQLQPEAAELAIDGPAERTADGLRFTGVGEVTLTPGAAGESGAAVTLEAIVPEVLEITVQDTIAISDARPPHFARQGDRREPAAILQEQPLTLAVTLGADQDLSAAAEVEVRATSGSVTLAGTVTVGAGLEDGATVTISSAGPLGTGVAINALDLTWTVGGATLAETTPLRIYTTYRAPIKNIARDQRAPNTKVHFENACRWAMGASQNNGQGSDSIAYQIDNQMRHFVHPKDYPASMDPAVPDYGQNAAPPKNYDDLDDYADQGGGDWRAAVYNGVRPVSSLYYPPLRPAKEYENYENYRNNFGWWVLDNPDHVGGRCNQQASLVCGIVGTVGIEGEILYLHRYGVGKRTGRPVRMYFYSNDSWPATSATGGGPWNFHGVALVTLADGSQWIYDGSFSSPPNRKNGTKTWAEGPGGPFIHSWTNYWVYDDGDRDENGYLRRVPADDVPTTWYGVQ